MIFWYWWSLFIPWTKEEIWLLTIDLHVCMFRSLVHELFGKHISPVFTKKDAGFRAKMLRTDEDLSHRNLGLNFKHVSNNLTASLGQTSTRFDQKHLSFFWLPLSPSNLETFPAGAKIQSHSRSHLMPLVHNVVHIYIYIYIYMLQKLPLYIYIYIYI